MKRLFFIMLIVLASGAAHAQELWRGAHYGDSVPRVLVASNAWPLFLEGRVRWESYEDETDLVLKGVMIEGIPFDVKYFFRDGTLDDVSLSGGVEAGFPPVRSGDFSQVLRALSLVYGPGRFRDIQASGFGDNYFASQSFLKNGVYVIAMCGECLGNGSIAIRISAGLENSD
jgi:hypothetical protein